MISYSSAFTKASSSAQCTGLGMPHTHTVRESLSGDLESKEAQGACLWEREFKKTLLTDKKKNLLLQEEQLVLDVSPLIHTVTSAVAQDGHKIIAAGFDISVAVWVFFMTVMPTGVRELPRNAGQIRSTATLSISNTFKVPLEDLNGREEVPPQETLGWSGTR